jgi:uncharacterized repeat protein (TIGR01451 family)
VTLKNVGQALCLALLVPASASAGSLPPLGVLREQAKLTGIGDAVGDRYEQFGIAVAGDGDTVIVGAPGTQNPGQGSAYVFVRTAGVWAQETRLRHPGVEGFGISVALDGDTAVVGSAYFSKAYVFVRGSGVWTEEAVLSGSDTGGAAFGASVSISGDTIVVGAPEDATGFGYRSGSAYVFVRSGNIWTQQQKLFSADLAAEDDLGRSVSVSADAIVLGAPGDDTGVGIDAGSAYVFSRSGTVWSQEAKLTAPVGPASFAFGTSVSLDGGSLVVGSPGETNAGVSGSGAAYVFVQSGSTWSLQQRVAPAAPGQNAYFGTAVALDADTAIVGAPYDHDQALYAAGSAYVFVRVGGVWAEQQRLAASAPLAQAYFGQSVAVFGDAALAGAPYRDQSGSAYVFRRAGSTWDEEAKLDAPGTARQDRFGSAAAIEGEILVVGGPDDDVPGGRGAGSAYVFVRTGQSWNFQQKILAGDPTERARFGAAVSLCGGTLAVAAPRAVASFAGAVYVFVQVGGVWQQQQRLERPGGSSSEEYAASVACDGDTLLVGAPSDAEAGLYYAGAAYVYTRSGGSWALQQRLTLSAPESFAGAGHAVALQGDTALVSAPGSSARGRVSVFQRSAGVWTETGSFSAADGTGGDEFGSALGLSGDTAIVGATNAEESPGSRPGAAYVFVQSLAGQWSQQQKLVDPHPVATLYLGSAVAVSGDAALVSPWRDYSARSGVALLFVRQAGVWTLRQRIVPSDGADDDEYGAALALSGATAVVGAPGADTPAGFDSGAVYVLVPAATDLGVTIGGAPPGVAQGDLVTYTIEVTNNGPETAPAVRVLDTLDAGLVVESASASQGTCALTGAGASCDLGTVPAGATATISVVAVGALVGPQTSLATIQWSGSDPVPGNDTASASTNVIAGAPADVSITNTGITSTAQVGSTVAYQLTIENLGPGTVAGLVVDDPAPPGLALSYVSGSDCSGGFPCRIPRLTVGEQRFLYVYFQVPASYPGPDPIVSTATVTSLTDDPVLLNNASTVQTPFFVPASNLDFHTLVPCRLLDTRSGGGSPLDAGSVASYFASGGPCGVPGTAKAIAVNVIVTQPTATGNLKLYPYGMPVPVVSTLNYAAGQTRGNNAVISLDEFGGLAIRVSQPSGTVHVILDVFGYFE